MLWSRNLFFFFFRGFRFWYSLIIDWFSNGYIWSQSRDCSQAWMQSTGQVGGNSSNGWKMLAQRDSHKAPGSKWLLTMVIAFKQEMLYLTGNHCCNLSQPSCWAKSFASPSDGDDPAVNKPYPYLTVNHQLFMVKGSLLRASPLMGTTFRPIYIESMQQRWRSRAQACLSWKL